MQKKIYIFLWKIQRITKRIYQIYYGLETYKQVTNYSGEPKFEYDVNTELLRWEVFAFSDSTVSMLFSVGGVVIFIIILTSIFCIRNSFAISITEKMKMYGMLSSVGATKKQIKKSVIYEAMMLRSDSVYP